MHIDQKFIDEYLANKEQSKKISRTYTVDEELYKLFKIYCAINGSTVSEELVRLMEEKIIR